MDYINYNELNGRLERISDEFHSKVSYDFRKFIFLGLRGETTKNLEEVVKMAASQDGYQGHKIFRYKEDTICHFYIRFRNTACAEKAIVYFRTMDNKFNADIVSNILLTWYMVEKVLAATQSLPTTTCVDKGNMDIGAVSVNHVRALLYPFGSPRLASHQPKTSNHLVFEFRTMAEALAATVAIGGWYHCRDLVRDHCSNYRVRIVGQVKEASVLDYSGSCSDEAFQMDYFVPASELLSDRKDVHSLKRLEAPGGSLQQQQRCSFAHDEQAEDSTSSELSD